MLIWWWPQQVNDWSPTELVADLISPLLSQDKEGGHLLNVLKVPVYNQGPDMCGAFEKLLVHGNALWPRLKTGNQAWVHILRRSSVKHRWHRRHAAKGGRTYMIGQLSGFFRQNKSCAGRFCHVQKMATLPRLRPDVRGFVVM